MGTRLQGSKRLQYGYRTLIYHPPPLPAITIVASASIHGASARHSVVSATRSPLDPFRSGRGGLKTVTSGTFGDLVCNPGARVAKPTAGGSYWNTE